MLFFFLTFPYWGEGQVIAPYRQFSELGALDNTGAKQIENHKFSDFSQSYVPEVFAHLHGPRSGWLTLWSNQNEEGRPTYHISGLSPAYPPSWIISKVVDSPMLFITVFSLLTCFFSGAFVLLFCREVSLSPLSGLIASSSVATSPFFMYWLTFPMFPAVWCWSFAALWAVTRIAKKADLLGWFFLSFSAYSLLMTGYPQPVVFHAYLLSGYVLSLTYRKLQIGFRATYFFLILAASAIVIGGAFTLPVYIDLFHTYLESARVSTDPSFFAGVLPHFGTWLEGLRFFVLHTTPELYGDPIAPAFPLPYDGLSITPVVVYFAIISLLVCHRKTWGWWLSIAIILLLAFVHPLYIFSVKHLGFNLSRSTPLGTIMVPLTVIVAYGADALERRYKLGDHAQAIGVATASVIGVIAIGVGFGFTQGYPIQSPILVAMILMACSLTAQYHSTRPMLLFAALILVAAFISYPLMLRQDPAQIALTSNLVAQVKKDLPADSRFAVASPGLPVLSPNLNATFEIASIHSYNSLSSKRYHNLIKSMNGEMLTYGRWNSAISPDYGSTMFWMSNIGLMLAPIKLSHKNLEYLGEESGVYLYKVLDRMGDSIQIFPVQKSNLVDAALNLEDPRQIMKSTPIKLLDQGDVMEFSVYSGMPSLFILSQKFHRDWQATTLDQFGWEAAKTTEINGVFQGVMLPKNVKRVRLEFKPYSRFAWIAHIFWLFLLVILGFDAWKRKKSIKE